MPQVAVRALPQPQAGACMPCTPRACVPPRPRWQPAETSPPRPPASRNELPPRRSTTPAAPTCRQSPAPCCGTRLVSRQQAETHLRSKGLTLADGAPEARFPAAPTSTGRLHCRFIAYQRCYRGQCSSEVFLARMRPCMQVRDDVSICWLCTSCSILTTAFSRENSARLIFGSCKVLAICTSLDDRTRFSAPQAARKDIERHRVALARPTSLLWWFFVLRRFTVICRDGRTAGLQHQSQGRHQVVRR